MVVLDVVVVVVELVQGVGEGIEEEEEGLLPPINNVPAAASVAFPPSTIRLQVKE